MNAQHNLLLTFTGDLCINGAFFEKVCNRKKIISEKLQELLKSSDFCVVNFEGPIGNQNTIHNGKQFLSSPENSIEYLVENNIKVFNLANNHIFDAGKDGFEKTQEEIARQKAKCFGAGTTLSGASNICYLQSNDITIALIGIARNEDNTASLKSAGIFSDRHLNLLKKQVKLAKQNADWVIVSYHGGEEFTLYPSPVKRRFLKRLIRNKDIDILICHHSHVFQGIEIIKNKPVFYSLGNFIFDLDSHKSYRYTQEGAILSFSFSKESYTYNMLPISIKPANGIVDVGNQSFLTHLNSISDFNGYYKKWLNEASRILFRIPNSNSFQKTTDMQNTHLLRLFFRIEFYKKLYKIASDKYTRSLYLSAIFNRVWQRIW